MRIITLTHKHAKAYLVSNNGEWLMIDCGWADSLPEFTRQLKSGGVSWSNVKYLCVTHFHPDHGGLTERLKEYGLTLLLHENQTGAFDELNRFFIKHPHKDYLPILKKGNRVITSKESRVIFGTLGLTGEIISTPGHSEDSVSAVFDGDCAFIGDHYNIAAAEGLGNPQVKESWEKIRAFGVKTIYHAHEERYEI